MLRNVLRKNFKIRIIIIHSIRHRQLILRFKMSDTSVDIVPQFDKLPNPFISSDMNKRDSERT